MIDIFHEYFQSMPGYVSVQDREFRLIDANRQFIESFGPIEDRYCYQVYKGRAEQCESCPVERTFRDGRSHTSRERVSCLDGTAVDVIVYTTPIRDESGAIVSVMEVSTDITEVTGLQEQLRQSRQSYRQLFEEVPCYISIQDEKLQIVNANRQFREAFGSFLGSKCYEIYKHNNEQCWPCPVQETFRDGGVHRSEEVVTARDGRQIHTLVYTAPIRDADGEVRRVMEMSTDITPIRELQTQLESIGILISSVSHGVKGLLNGLDGGMYLVNTGMQKDKPERVTQGWEMVQRNVDRIRGMVMNILYYAKEREPNHEPLSAVAIGEEVLSVLADKAQELGIALEPDFAADTGEFAADHQAMRSMLVNLLENSLDACRVDDKKDAHQVSFVIRGEPDGVVFEISDNGIGMDQETREKAYSLFFSSKGAKGTGLGLFIADKITKAHGGSIQLESALDKGSRFIVQIPRKKV
jgi:PAS domain S-box-containing protein